MTKIVRLKFTHLERPRLEPSTKIQQDSLAPSHDLTRFDKITWRPTGIDRKSKWRNLAESPNSERIYRPDLTELATRNLSVQIFLSEFGFSGARISRSQNFPEHEFQHYI